MAWAVHACDDGRFRIWSTVVDDYVSDRLTRSEVVERFVERDAKRARELARTLTDEAAEAVKIAADHGDDYCELREGELAALLASGDDDDDDEGER